VLKKESARLQQPESSVRFTPKNTETKGQPSSRKNSESNPKGNLK